MVGKAQKSHGAKSWMNGGCSRSASIATSAVCCLAFSWRLPS
jgi:hypothetical protein